MIEKRTQETERTANFQCQFAERAIQGKESLSVISYLQKPELHIELLDVLLEESGYATRQDQARKQGAFNLKCRKTHVKI